MAGRTADRLLPVRAEGPLPLLRARKLDDRALQPCRRQEGLLPRAGTIRGSSRWRSRRTVRRHTAAAAKGGSSCWETAAASPKPIRTIEAHRGWVRAMAVSPDGTLLATGGNDRIVRLWESIDRLAGSRAERAPRPYLFTRISSRRQDALERRSPGRDQGMGSGFRSRRSAASTPRPCIPMKAGSKSTSAACEAWRSQPDGSSSRRRRLAQGDQPSGGRARTARAGLRRQEPKARENSADRWHHRRRDLAASLPRRRQPDGRLRRHQRRDSCSSGNRAQTKTITASPCPISSATWTFTPTASASPPPTTTAPPESHLLSPLEAT